METLQLTLDTVFHEAIGHNALQMQHYERLYQIPRLQYLQHTCAKTLSYIRKKQYFVIVVLYTGDGHVYAKYDGTNRGLPASGVRHDENINSALMRIINKIHIDLDVRDIQPLTFIDNSFCHKDEAYTMHGMVFCGRIGNTEAVEEQNNGGLFPLSSDFIDSIQKYGNRDILTYFDQYFSKFLKPTTKQDKQDSEIEINTSMQTRYIIHGLVIKPLLKALGINQNTTIKTRIRKHCIDAKSIIDVSCGDDLLVRDLAIDNRLVVANDISRKQIELLGIKSEDHILCTNHNATKLPFKEKSFDVAICKNTLHHMPHREHLLALINNLRIVAKRIIIVEIENPLITGGIARLLHKRRYRRFLKDNGGAYLNQKQFLELIHYTVGNTHSYTTGIHQTPQGNYFWAIADIL